MKCVTIVVLITILQKLGTNFLFMKEKQTDMFNVQFIELEQWCHL